MTGEYAPIIEPLDGYGWPRLDLTGPKGAVVSLTKYDSITLRVPPWTDVMINETRLYTIAELRQMLGMDPLP